MKRKQKTAKILSIICLVLCLITIILAFIVINSYLEINPISAACLYPILLSLALMLSVIAISLDRRQILAWLTFIFVIILFSFSIYIITGLGSLPIGAGTN